MKSMRIYYDGQCPFCDKYTKLLRIRETVEELVLVDLRQSPSDRERFAEKRINPDKGMIVDYGGRLWTGGEAMCLLASLSEKQGLFSRFNRCLMANRVMAVIAYPILRLLRNLILLILGRDSLARNEGCYKNVWAVFVWGWAIFSMLHFIVYFTQFNTPLYLSTWLIPLLALPLIVKPRSKRLFLFLVLVQITDALLQMPSFSNHTALKNFFLLAVAISGLFHAMRGDSWAKFVETLMPLGRALLCIMYIFGVWHKINTDFLDPNVSCAPALWAEMPVFLSVIDHPMMDWLGIYGTLVIESLILGCLLIRRLRWIGIVVGVLFHSLLGLSQYAFYPAFSSLTVALHLLFLSPRAAEKITSSKIWRTLIEPGRYLWLRVLGCSVWLGAIAFLASIALYSAAAAVWLIGMTWFFRLLFEESRQDDSRGWLEMIWSPLLIGNVVTVLFFLNCITPYLGLKTAQSMNMFANLRLEGGVSNHLILSNPPGPFNYLEDVVSVTASSGSIYLMQLQRDNYGLTYYQLLSLLADSPEVEVSFERNGMVYLDQNSQSLEFDIEEILHPFWFRKWFHFIPVDLKTPKRCALDK